MERKHFKHLCEAIKQMKKIMRGEMKPFRVTVYSDAEVAAIRAAPPLSKMSKMSKVSKVRKAKRKKLK